MGALQSVVSRRVPPLEAAVISVCRFHAGSALNVIPETAELAGTMRAMTTTVQKQLQRATAAHGAGVYQRAFNVECDLEVEEVFPPCLNDPQVVEFMEQCAGDVVGAGQGAPFTAGDRLRGFRLFHPGGSRRHSTAGMRRRPRRARPALAPVSTLTTRCSSPGCGFSTKRCRATWAEPAGRLQNFGAAP